MKPLNRFQRLMVCVLIGSLGGLTLRNVIADFLKPDIVQAQVDIVPVRPLYVRKTFSGATAASGVNTTNSVITIAAAGVGLSNYFSQVVCNNTSSTATDLQITEGGVPIAHAPCPPSGAAGVTRFDPPVQGTANTADAIAFSIAVGTGHVYAAGFVGSN